MDIKSKFSQIRPAVKHGLLAGAVLMMVKVVFVSSGSWELRFAPYYPLLSFLPIYAAMIIASKTEKMAQLAEFTYWRAFKSAMITVSIAVFIGSFTEFLIYTFNSNVKNLGIEILRSQMIQSFKYMGKFYTNQEKDAMVRAVNPGSLVYVLSQMFGLIFSNGILVLIIALFTRFKPNRHDWLNSDSSS